MNPSGLASATVAAVSELSARSALRTVSSPSLGVIRVRTRETLARPDIAQLIMRGARECGFPVPSAILAELLVDPGGEKIGIFVGTVEDKVRAVTIGFLPMGAFWVAAAVSLAYAEHAPRKLVRTVAARLREWFRENGHNRVIVGNLLHTDRSYMRGLTHFGRPSVIGSVIQFEW